MQADFWLRRFRLSLVFLFLSFFVTQHALAFSITPVMGYSSPNASINPTTGFIVTARNPTFCLGSFFEFSMFTRFFLETGVIYGARGFMEDANQFTFTGVQIPLVVRMYLAPVFSVGVGVYYFHGIGNYQINDSFPPYSFGTYGSNDYGSVLSAAFKFKLALRTSLVLDGRYLYGLQNVDQSGASTTFLNDIQAFAGVSFQL